MGASRFGIGLLVGFYCLFGASARSEIIGTDLYKACNAASGSPEQDVCAAFILGIIEGVDYGGMARSPTRKPCLKQYLSEQQAELIVKKYMSDHPEQLGYDAGMVVSVAIMNAFGGCQPG
jgi:hypothetical protein